VTSCPSSAGDGAFPDEIRDDIRDDDVRDDDDVVDADNVDADDTRDIYSPRDSVPVRASRLPW